MSMPSQSDERPARSGFSGIQVIGIVLASIAVTMLAAVWIVRTYVFPTQFAPVELTAVEQRNLDAKIDRLDKIALPASRRPKAADPGDAPTVPSAEEDQKWLDSGAYDESRAEREIEFSERELNGLMASNPDLARRAAIDLSDDLASARLLIPVDPDFPVLGGRTLRVSAGVQLAYAQGRPVIALRGVSLMGIPIPNAWLGNLKDVDLVERFGGNAGFWKAFAAGVEDIEIRDGRVHVRLRE